MVKKVSSKKNKGVKAKSIKKKTVQGAKSTEVVYHSTKEIKVEKALIENFIGLQKVMVNLSAKFDNLSNQISKLLDLFEISAKSLAKKEFSASGDMEAKKVMDKLENISKQAGLIGRGLALIHEVGTENQMPVIPLNLQRNKNPILSPRAIPIKQITPMREPNTQRMTSELGGFERSAKIKEQKPGENA